MAPQLVDLRGVSKCFGETEAVSAVDVQLGPGQMLGLAGPDGAGKTTLMRLLAGVMLPDAGEVHIGGFDMMHEADLAREQLGYLSQRFSLYEDLTVLENIRFFAEVRGLSAERWRPRALEILDFVGLVDFQDRQAGNLSGGMKQKLGLASALVHRPQLLLLDEPTGGVDPVTSQDFWQLLLRIVAEEGVAVLVSTPYMDEVARCHEVAMMKAGRIVLQGTPEELRAPLAGRIVEALGAGWMDKRATLRSLEGVEDVQTFGDRLHLRVAVASDRLIATIQAVHPAGAVRLARPTLEDVFIAFVENGEAQFA